ncbi:hypothetical protein C7H19_15070 [Aphanothece hegewaldii CCALA 016]|uniref:Uncharacterized protein n=1 Tax=Aphanothece hegewaldii CCALA 016 TaxID=2107694 RepID=A0A2T1LW21_9CHRO|nr:hypothetical protein [Aphanothece hegewaldii]PSF36061.1 hypothetical protein C7H19_15070 [Aphanothece hegewaldii CCALA 016]
MLALEEKTKIVRNYFLTSALVIFTSVVVTDLFYSPIRIGQQEKLENYSNYVTAGLVSYTVNYCQKIKD